MTPKNTQLKTPQAVSNWVYRSHIE